jgi:hypothetical protein
MTSVPTIPEIEGPSSSNLDAVSITFDYSQLATTVAMDVRESAARIRVREHNVVQEIFPIGRELRLVKAALPHGAFEPWLEAEFGWNERTVQRYMRADEVLGEKSDIMSDLTATAIYGLSARSTTREVREEIIRRLEAGERLTSQAVLERVKKRRKATPSSASDVPDEQSVEQELDEHPIGQFGQLAAPDEDSRFDTPTPARRAADLIVKQVKDDWDELAACLAEADSDEFLRHLLQRCSAQCV